MNFKKYHVSKNLFDKNSNTTNDKGQVRSGVMIPQGIYSINNTTGRAIYYRIGNEGTTMQINGGGKAENILANDDLYVWQGIREDGVMLNTGSEALPYEPYGNSWTDTPHYIHNTSTDTITTLPAVLYPTGTTATVGLKGQAVQSTTPTPDNPVMPQGTGDMTGNLFDINGTVSYIYTDVSISNNRINITSIGGGASSRVYFAKEYPTGTYTITAKFNGGITKVRFFSTVQFQGGTYNGYYGGYFVDIGDSLTVTLTEPFTMGIIVVGTAGSSGTVYDIMLNVGSQPIPYEPFGYKIPISINGNITNIYIGDNPLRKSLDGTAYDTLAADGTLTQRVDSDGSVLATPVVTQITMPTFTLADGANTISVDTTVQPSEVTVNYKGWHPVADVHERSGGQWD